ncbi:MAG: Holliday junction resolvase Hjc [Candidatus Micrarchaeia archaeon]
MNRYTKGARGERELLNKFHELGYSVVRSAGSGVNSISPDIIAIKNGKGYSFECKAWDKGRIGIEIEKFEMLKEWERNTAMQTFIAWRMSGKGWFFMKLDELVKGDKDYSITMRRALEINRVLDSIVRQD